MTTTYQKIDPEFKAKWVAALRSGEYEQGKFKLHPHGNCYCCLGVACLVAGIEEPNDVDNGAGRIEFSVSPRSAAGKVPATLNFTQARISGMNDYDNKSFAEIADWIEANL